MTVIGRLVDGNGLLDFTANDFNDIRRTIALLRNLYDELLEHVDERDIRWRVWSQLKAAHVHLTELLEGKP